MIAEALFLYPRIRIFAGWFRRSVVFTKKADGYDWKPEGIRPTKAELPAFIELLRVIRASS